MPDRQVPWSTVTRDASEARACVGASSGQPRLQGCPAGVTKPGLDDDGDDEPQGEEDEALPGPAGHRAHQECKGQEEGGVSEPAMHVGLQEPTVA